ncbi:hypothetical protein NW198_04355 [Thermophilibacter sp. ET337]|uniref:hypothetical protein n=1 Tax=Thermophilibacter sp. ET337 TaxID=2973084 RepID=UPI0021ABC2A5|nr:hypothetical protein [Thermophilibacter sp. ET337]MCR8907849.1 hypothetical protein [Thermophilibacter sp. ET337]
MDRHTLEQFRTRARRVTLPENVRESVLDEIRVEKNERARGTRQPRRSMTRRAAVGAGLAVLGGAAALLALSVIVRPGEDAPATTEGNWFVLKAYADGVSQGEGTVLAQRSISLAGSLGGSESSGWYAAHSIDLRCEGADIDRIDYALEGEFVSPEGQPDEEFTENAVWFDALYRRPYEVGEGEAYPDHGGTGAGFSVSYEEQQADEESFNRQVWTSFPTDDEIRAARAAKDALPIDAATLEDELARQQALNRFRFVLERRSADILAQTTLVMTVTFADGSEQVKRYRISPAENFDETYQSYLDRRARNGAILSYYRNAEPKPEEYLEAQEATDGLYANWPDLYTITEVSE